MKLTVDLAPDVIEILKGLEESPSGAIEHLARSYYSIMEDAGVESEPVVIPEPVTNTTTDDLPSQSDVETTMQHLSQPRGSLGEVRTRVHDKALPRDGNGLVQRNYIIASGAHILSSLLNTDEYTEHAEERIQAIQEVLSKIPEDTWNGASVPSLVDRAYSEILNGRRPVGTKT